MKTRKMTESSVKTGSWGGVGRGGWVVIEAEKQNTKVGISAGIVFPPHGKRHMGRVGRELREVRGMFAPVSCEGSGFRACKEKGLGAVPTSGAHTLNAPHSPGDTGFTVSS